MKSKINSFEMKVSKKFLQNGYYIFDIDKKKILKEIHFLVTDFFQKKLKKKIKLERLNSFIEPSELNKIRMELYSFLNDKKNFVHNYYELGEEILNIICGDELVMQRKINLSIQLSLDDSSLLPLHSDVWSGCSPYEVVLWIPLVNCNKTNSMYILPKNYNQEFYKNFIKYNSVKNIENKILKKAKFLKIKFGQGLIFQHQLMHGNVINKENTSRISFNCRFKSLFSPYDTKGIGETFKPLKIKPATLFGMNYNDPKIKKIRF